jgi:hypothetical protein
MHLHAFLKLVSQVRIHSEVLSEIVSDERRGGLGLPDSAAFPSSSAPLIAATSPREISLWTINWFDV